MNTKLRSLSVLIPLLLTGKATAAGMTVTGTLETKVPGVTGTAQGVLYEGVSNSIVSLAGQHNGCQVLFSPSATPPAGALGCYVQIGTVPAGMAYDFNKAQIAGFSTVFGAQSVPYTITYYSGSAKTPVTVGSGSIPFTITHTTPPLVTGYESKFDLATYQSGATANVHKRQATGTIRIVASAQPYVQSFKVDGFADCNIAIGATSCDAVNNDMYSLAAGETGGGPLGVVGNSQNQYFNNQLSQFSLLWDFRPPVTKDVVESNVESPLVKIATGAGPREVLFSHIAATITSPHSTDPLGWWKPVNSKLTLTPDPDSVRKSSLQYQGKTLFTAAGHTSGSVNVSPSGAYVQTAANEFLYDFDLSATKDGDFIAKVEAVDSYNNKSVSNGKKITLNRQPPQVGIFDAKLDDINSNKVLFFFDGLVVAGFNGYDDGLESVSAAINGINIPLSSTDTKGVYTTGVVDTSSLQAGTSYPLTVTAVDKLGRKSVKEIQVQYAASDLELTPSKLNPTQFTEAVTVSVKSTGAYNCPLFFGDEQAKTAAAEKNAVQCFAVWSLPKNMVIDVNLNGRVSLTGYIDEDVGKIGYTLYAYSPNGQKLKVRTGGIEIQPKLAVAPTVKFYGRRMLGDKAFMVDITGGTAGGALVTSSPGKVNVSVEGTGITSSSESFNQRARNKSDTGSYSVRVKVPKGNIWTVYPITVTASYDRTDKFKTVEQANAYLVPTKQLRLTLGGLRNEAATTETGKVTAKIGVYNVKTKDVDYDKAVHGEWQVHLEQLKTVRDENGKVKIQRTRLTPDVNTNASGVAELTFDPSTVTGKNITYQAIASVISPIPDFSLQVKSSKKHVVMIKGQAVDGKVNGETILDRLPVSASIVVKAATKEDRDALGDIVWQARTGDTGDWTRVPEMDNKQTYRFERAVAGKWQVRAILKNRLTGVEQPTEVTTIVGYDKPEIELKQDRIVIAGDEVPLTLTGKKGAPITDDLHVQWSLDGSSWIDGDIQASLIPDKTARYIYARAQFADTEGEASDVSWTTTKLLPRAITPELLKLAITSPVSVETNKEFELKGAFKNNYELVDGVTFSQEWVMPDASVQSGSTAKWSVAEEGVESQFIYRVWVNGHKDETLTEMKRSVKSWAYHFPTLTTNQRQSYQLAPTRIEVYSSTKLPVVEGVTYDIKFVVPEGVEVLSQADGRLIGTIKNAGVYTIKVILTDNRGNIDVKEHLFAADEAAPMFLELKPSYSSKFMRQPLDVIMSSGIRLDHIKDGVQSLSWYLDGVKQEGDLRKQVFSGLTVGKHTIRLDVVSDFGQRGTVEKEVEVVANQAPNCTPSVDTTSVAWRVKIGCQDPDGRMFTYRWKVGGEPVGNISNSISLTKSFYQRPLSVEAVGVDDSGDETGVSVTLE